MQTGDFNKQMISGDHVTLKTFSMTITDINYKNSNISLYEHNRLVSRASKKSY